MNKKSIKLEIGNYRLNNNIVEIFSADGYMDYATGEEPEYSWKKSRYNVGEEVMLISTENVSPNTLRAGGVNPSYSLVFDAPDGIGGNMNNEIKRYHGWRGTTSDIETYAHGLRRIISVNELKNGQITVTVGVDLHPEED